MNLDLLQTSILGTKIACIYLRMHSATSRRAGAGLLALVVASQCRTTEQRLCQRATRLHQTRPITSSPRKWQQPASAPTSQQNPAPPPPQTPSPPQAAANSTKIHHELSPSSESEPLRTLTDGLDDPPPVLSEGERQVDWTRSYHGLSSSPFTAEQADILMRKIDWDDIEIKPDGIIYLPEIKYRRILNRAFGPGGWGLAPRGETIVTGRTVTREYGLVAGGRYAITYPNPPCPLPTQINRCLLSA